MAPMTSLDPIRHSIVVPASRERAFHAFTHRVGDWWPATNSIGGAPQADVTIEPRAGGRWFEETADGQQCTWGEVLVWEPPARLVLAWQLNSARPTVGDTDDCRDFWVYDAAFRTEVELGFTALEPFLTRVDLEHRHLDRFEHPVPARLYLDADSGWPGLLTRFARGVEAS